MPTRAAVGGFENVDDERVHATGLRKFAVSERFNKRAAKVGLAHHEVVGEIRADRLDIADADAECGPVYLNQTASAVDPVLTYRAVAITALGPVDIHRKSDDEHGLHDV